MFGEVSEHYGGVRNVSESEKNGSDHFWKVVLVIGRFQKIPEGSGSFRLPEKSHMEGNMGRTHVASGPHGPTSGLAEIGGERGVLVGLQLPP